MHLWADAIGKVTEEIMTEDAGDAPQQVDVNILFAEYFVDIRAGAAQLGSEPGDGASLFLKCAFDKLSRMNHAILLFVSS